MCRHSTLGETERKENTVNTDPNGRRVLVIGGLKYLADAPLPTGDNTTAFTGQPNCDKGFTVRAGLHRVRAGW